LPNPASSNSIPRDPLKPSRVIPLLLVCALGAIAFTCVGGFIVYSNTQHMIETRDWLDHSHNVLTSLQGQSQRLDSIDYEMQLYNATRDPSQLRAAQSAAVSMHAGVLNLGGLLRYRSFQDVQRYLWA
jgi:hypothetical protein